MNLWLPKDLAKVLYEQVEYHVPNETGGVLMGYIAFRDYVVTHIIGPGPDAMHAKNKFIPDHEYQCKKIAEHFKNTDGTETYLGDWHSHPDTSAYLSPQDKITLKNIAEFEKARIANPVLMVLGTIPVQIKAWKYLVKNKCELQRIRLY